MKKISTLLLFIIMGTGIMYSQNCLDFFPETEGSVLTTKTYDAANNLQNTMIYTVKEVRNNPVINSMEIAFTMMDNNNNMVSAATIETTCSDGTFNLKMVNKGYSPELIRALTTNTELVSYFLDYPDNSDYPIGSTFDMDGGEYRIEDKNNNIDIEVRIDNRLNEGWEKVRTPARIDSFDAYKITFDFSVEQNGETTWLKGVEWYSPSYGIIRSETYDKDNNLITRTELAEMQIM